MMDIADRWQWFNDEDKTDYPEYDDDEPWAVYEPREDDDDE